LTTKLFQTNKSKLLFEQAKKSMVGGVASKMHMSEWEQYPIYVDHGEGSHIIDVDGNDYIDYWNGYGPTILGFTPQEVIQAVIDQAQKGSQFAAPFEMLNEVSAKLVDIIPCADLVDYETSGTEAVMLALRLARAHTGKSKFIRFEGHYHGWADEVLVSSGPASLKKMGPRSKPWKVLGSVGQRKGTIGDVIVLPWNDLDLVRETVSRQKNEIAAIITEPVMANCEVVLAQPGYLEGLREISANNGIDLIFDEVITGFRLALGGAQDYYRIVPDISTFAKAVAGGYPLAGVTGRSDVMNSGVHPLGTFNGNPIAIAACKATLKALEQPGVYERLDSITDGITRGINEIGGRLGLDFCCSHVGSIWWLQFGIREPLTDYRGSFKVDKDTYQKFRLLCQERGLRLHPWRGRFYTSTAHTQKDVEKTLEIVEEAMTILIKKSLP
jgi:glutamate-1-semialdehyde 2,1-aminomutase